VVSDDPVEITDWDTLSGFSGVDDTRTLINKVLHYEVLGSETRYWLVKVSLDHADRTMDTLLTGKGGKWLPTLYDLLLDDQSGEMERTNYHAVQFVETFETGYHFVHVTDLHLARRNDEMLDEVLSVRTDRSPQKISDSYVNFNENFRKFIERANIMWEAGEIDFIVIGGDIVDFAFCGWESGANEGENNWKTFREIMIGDRARPDRSNASGLRVASFTSTGNHDWRTWPYKPDEISRPGTFGLEVEEIRNYSFRPFDALRYAVERQELEQEMIQDLSEEYNLAALKRTSYLNTTIWMWLHTMAGWCVNLLEPPAVSAILALAAGPGMAAALGISWPWPWLTMSIAGATIPFVLRWAVKKLFRRAARFIVDFPIYARSTAIHYYLKHVNPFLDYAFQWGQHSFIVMDTGSDVFTGSFLDEKDASNIKRLSIKDNILGGSPDSRGFDSAHLYYNWSQIVWLDEVLTAVNPCHRETTGRVFLFLHAPPLNVGDSIDYVMSRYSERALEQWAQSPWIPREKYDLTFGTLNHYVSQLFYLCLGYRESEVWHEAAEKRFRPVDVVFSGHAHRNIEFRMARGRPTTNEQPNLLESVRRSVQQLLGWTIWRPRQRNRRTIDVRIYCDAYSEMLGEQCTDCESACQWWESKKPFFVQTAACGLRGDDDPDPPYYRRVGVDPDGVVTDFQAVNLTGPIHYPSYSACPGGGSQRTS